MPRETDHVSDTSSKSIRMDNKFKLGTNKTVFGTIRAPSVPEPDSEKNRINFSLDPTTLEKLTYTAAATGISVKEVIRELVENSKLPEPIRRPHTGKEKDKEWIFLDPV